MACSGCGLIRLADIPDAQSLSKIYSTENGYHAQYLEAACQIGVSKNIQDHLKVLTRNAAGRKLLDIGCSAGFFIKAAQNAGFEVDGVEFDPKVARIAQERTGTVVMAGSILDLHIEKRFDAITLWDVIEHLSDPGEALRKCHSLLEQNGVLFISTPNSGGLYPRISLYLNPVLKEWSHAEPPFHLYQFSKKTMSLLLKANGFEPIRYYSRLIPLSYSFGNPSVLFRRARRLLFASCFAPLSLIGSLIGLGDSMIIVSKKVGNAR